MKYEKTDLGFVNSIRALLGLKPIRVERIRAGERVLMGRRRNPGVFVRYVKGPGSIVMCRGRDGNLCIVGRGSVRRVKDAGELAL